LCRWEPWHCRLHLYHQWIAGGDVLTLAHAYAGARSSTDPDPDAEPNARSSTKPDAGTGAVSYAYAAPWTITHAHTDSYSDRVARPRRFGG
jgi:hypothetical protein